VIAAPAPSPTNLEPAPRVLLVEDDEEYAIDLQSKLRHSHAKSPRLSVDIARDFETALKFLDEDQIDIYIIDLSIIESPGTKDARKEAGIRLIQRIVARSSAGIIVHSSLSQDTEAEPLLNGGADDYIEKSLHAPQIIGAKIWALWRRIQQTRPQFSERFVHSRRVFQVGNWRFVIGDRDLVSVSGETARLSPTEHAFLRHLCTLEGHEIERREFNVSVLGRKEHEDDGRIDNMIYRLRDKLGPSFDLISKGKGVYRLLSVKVLNSAAP
jgi:DNA-binding response OmpR family regulator